MAHAATGKATENKTIDRYKCGSKQKAPGKNTLSPFPGASHKPDLRRPETCIYSGASRSEAGAVQKRRSDVTKKSKNAAFESCGTFQCSVLLTLIPVSL